MNFDFIPRDGSEREMFIARVKANREKATTIREWDWEQFGGIPHSFVCGCLVIEHGRGETPIRQCHAHLGSDGWPSGGQRLPDFADAVVASTWAEWVANHIRGDEATR